MSKAQKGNKESKKPKADKNRPQATISAYRSAQGQGKPTSSPGLMSSEALAAQFGLSAAPSNQGGSNFATSGAKNVDVNTAINGGFQQAIPTVTQINNYLAANGGRANPNALGLHGRVLISSAPPALCSGSAGRP